MLDAIHSAKKTITLETYIYWSGNIGAQFTSALVERAQHGVHVHVMIDSYGSAKIDRAYVTELKAAGAEVYQYHPFHFYNIASFRQIDHRTHRKILVVDGTIGFIGGVGIADEWTGNAADPQHWRDNHYRVRGPVVANLQAAFMENWIQTTGEVLDGDAYFPPLHDVGNQTAQVFKSSFQSGSDSMQLLFLLSIAAARKSVQMESAYFVPDKLTCQYLIAAARRGVKVEIIVPGRHIDQQIVRVASRARWGGLLNAGIKIYEYQGTMFHCKQMIVDNTWVSIGSANLDNRSFRLNDEANLNVIDGDFARAAANFFNRQIPRKKSPTICGNIEAPSRHSSTSSLAPQAMKCKQTAALQPSPNNPVPMRTIVAPSSIATW